MKKKINTSIILSIFVIILLIYFWSKEMYEAVTWVLVGVGLSGLHYFEKWRKERRKK